MAVSFNFDNSFNLKDRLKIKRWIKQVVENAGFRLGSVSYIFCSDEKILEVNKQYLNHDFYTDIITFDYVEKDIINGDIFISTDRVRENAQEFNVAFEEELHRVIIHGILHLLGQQDHSPKEEKQMRKKENEALLLFK
ncbi:MAG: rRNA maturation RNase YbeY [Synergistales bacterium]|nr:rRNA maturation RNase YbeY [Bacteroidales bacterium]MDY6435270.1 rRNA maturation RNase YbeY [Synergistales bacterium]MEE3413537.1 rRNA maturation RNase YbeY [Bacteroidales bacterium]